MSVYTYWDEDDPSILRTDIIGDWQWETYLDTMYKLVSTKPDHHRVDHIVDLRHSQSAPREDALGYLRRIAEQRESNPGITVIVGASRFIETLLETFSRIYGTTFTPNIVVETMDDAYARIEQARVRDNASAS